MLFTDIIPYVCGADAGPFRLAVDDEKFSNRFLRKKPMEFGSWTTREILIASSAGVRGPSLWPVALYPAALAGW